MKTIIAIEKAEYIEDYKLHLSFSDGETQIIDFEPFPLTQSSGCTW